MEKAAALIFLSASNLTEEPVALQTPRSVLSKTRWLSHSKMSLVSAPGSVLIKKNAYEVTSRGVVVVPRPAFLSKQVQTIVACRQRDAQTIEVLIHF